MEEEVCPIRQQQRRLNPTILDVVKKEMTKLLTVGIIYPILDSSWVSPAQVVPKKSGMIEAEPSNPQRLFSSTFLRPSPGEASREVPLLPRWIFRIHDAIWTMQFPKHIPEMHAEHFLIFIRGLHGGVHGRLHSVSRDFRCMCRKSGPSTEIDLVLNFEKCHFMVIEGIVLGHLVSSRWIEVDKAKIDIITSLPNPAFVREVRSFLGHASFYRRFIKNFSKTALPLSKLLQKYVEFVFNKECIQAFEELKTRLTSTPILQAPNWELPFELICNASNSALGAVLGQRDEVGGPAHVIPYASRTMDQA
ncbi:Retrovirus-related Pol polyprotein, partial [Mucuna pruriens]